MIYLIGWPPKCGKTTLAKTLSKRTGISWVSTDTLQCIVAPYMSDEEYAINFPTSQQRWKSNDEKYSRYSTEEIIRAYRTQAKSVFAGIEAFIECEITEKNDYIIEGYHIEPTLVVSLQEKYPGMIRSLFLIKSDQDQFVQDILKSTTPNDWIITRTTNPETFWKIAQMITQYGAILWIEAQKYGIKVLNMDIQFAEKIHEARQYFGF